MVTVEFGGGVVNADAGGPVANVGVSLGNVSYPESQQGWVRPTNTATSGGDGTFTLRVNLPSSWSFVRLNLTGPAGYDDTSQRYEGTGPFANLGGPTAADRLAIPMYPTLVIRPGESIEVRVDPGINLCTFLGGFDCRRVLVEAPPGTPVELDIVPHDSSNLCGLVESIWDEEPVLRRMVAGGVAYVYGTGTGTLTARR